jgi:NAD(P)H-dependent flavin oxidoreductase YrpB (nitropropane dioxygenase family)
VNFHMFQPGAAEIVEIIANKDQVRAVSFGRGPDAKMIGRFKRCGHSLHAPPSVRSSMRRRWSNSGATWSRPGRRRRRAYRIGADHRAAAAGARRGDVPVVAAGGFGDGRGLAAALAYGAVRHGHGHPLS